jgi:hypothetical protein
VTRKLFTSKDEKVKVNAQIQWIFSGCHVDSLKLIFCVLDALKSVISNLKDCAPLNLRGENPRLSRKERAVDLTLLYPP